MKYLDIEEFRERGYLQEVNRRFFHPLGLALEMTPATADEPARLSGVWDYRDDPEGVYFADGVSAAKADAIDQELIARIPARLARLGYTIQPANE